MQVIRNILCFLGFHSYEEICVEQVHKMEEGYINPRFVLYECSHCKNKSMNFEHDV